MAQALPAAARDVIERVCLSYRDWAPTQPRPPSLAGILADGDVNLSLLLRGEGECWVLRIPRADRPDGVCYRREVHLHALAAARSLAPPIALAEPATGLLVTTCIGEGRAGPAAPAADSAPGPATPPDRASALHARSQPAAIAGLLRAIHALDTAGLPVCPGVTAPARAAAAAALDLSPLDAPRELARLRRGLAHRDPLRDLPPAPRRCLQRAIERGRARSSNGVICHNDLLRANRLVCRGQLLAIDWEYARPGDAFFDLAVVASELDADDRAALLAAYLQRHPTGGEWQHLVDQLMLYTAIAACWYARHGSTGATRSALDRLTSLARSALHGADRPWR